MPMNKAAGNMYDFVTHTWNPVKGRCGYNCSYCYVKKIARRFGREQWGPYRDEKELKANLGEGNHIFVCSSCDLFHADVLGNYTAQVMAYSKKFPGNRYLWHTKNPRRALVFQDQFGENGMLCVTIESNIHRPEISKAPSPLERFVALVRWEKPWMLTIEPVMDFNLREFRALIEMNMPVQVNIGADSGNNNRPEPGAEKLRELIDWLKPLTKVVLKKNLARLLPGLSGGKGA